MPTRAQLETEAVFRAELVTPELDWLVTELCRFFGVPRGNGGTRGDVNHLNGGHRSQAWILNSRYCTNRTYTVEAGLNGEQARWISAFDITLPHHHMLTISRNADKATRSGQLEELVEWFGNVDGDQRVDGWNNIKNQVASSDSSHLWHLHGRIKRLLMNQMPVMRKIFVALTTGVVPQNGSLIMALSDAQMLTILKMVENAERGVTAWYTGADPTPFPNPWPGSPAGGYPNPMKKLLADLATVKEAVTTAPPVVMTEADRGAIIDALYEKLSEKLGPLVESASEAAVRKVLGAVDGAVPPPPSQ